MSLTNFFKRQPNSVNTESPSDPYKQISFSQCGEDLLIRFIFDNVLKIESPTFLDIGAYNPFHLNNTYFFYLRGSRGINVDANPNSIKLFERLRPEDTNLNVGVSTESGRLEFFEHENPVLSTFNEKEALTNGGYKSKRMVEVTTVYEIIKRYADGVFPDLFSLDVEGLDLEILESVDFKGSRPKVICVETISKVAEREWKRSSEIVKMLEQKGYYKHSDTGINTIFIDEVLMPSKITW